MLLDEATGLPEADTLLFADPLARVKICALGRTHEDLEGSGLVHRVAGAALPIQTRLSPWVDCDLGKSMVV